MRLSLSQTGTAALLIGVFCFYAILQIGWLAVDERPVVEDRDFIRVAHWGHVLRRDTLSGVYPPKAGYVRHSPLLTLWTAPVLAVFGCRADVAVLSLLPFAGFLMLALYQIARRYLSCAASVTAAVLVLAFHHFAVVEPLYPAYSFMKEYKADLPLSAIVAVTFWAMLMLHEHASRHAIEFAAITMALGMLTRISYPFYGAILAVALWAGGWRDRAFWIRIATAFGIALCVAAPWYLFHAGGVMRYFTERELNSAWAHHTGMPEFLSSENLLFYLRGLRNLLSWPFLVFSLLGLFLMLVRRARGTGFILSGLFVTYLVLLLLPGKSVRFLTPCLFLLALGAAAPLDMLRTVWLRRLAAAIIIAIACFRLLCMNGLVHGTVDVSGISSAELSPIANDWCVGDIFKDVVDAHHRDSVLRIAVVPFLGHFRHGSFMQEALEQGIRLRDESTWLIRGNAWREELEQADFLVTKTGDNGPALYAPHSKAINSWLESEQGKGFVLSGHYALPDGSNALLYHQRNRFAPQWTLLPERSSTQVIAQFGDSILLRSVHMSRGADVLRIRCEWEATAKADRDYRFFIQLRRGSQNLVAESFVPARGSLPTGVWTSGLHLVETYEVPLSRVGDGTPYTIWCGFNRGFFRLPIAQSHQDVFLRAVNLGSSLLLPENAPPCEGL